MVRDAIEANAGPTIYICPGKYKEALSISQDLTLIGAGSGDGVEDTVLHGQVNKRVLTINSGVNVDLKSLRITGGSVSGASVDGDGGGILVLGEGVPTTLTMNVCVVLENSASRGGGTSSTLKATCR